MNTNRGEDGYVEELKKELKSAIGVNRKLIELQAQIDYIAEIAITAMGCQTSKPNKSIKEENERFANFKKLIEATK